MLRGAMAGLGGGSERKKDRRERGRRPRQGGKTSVSPAIFNVISSKYCP